MKSKKQQRQRAISTRILQSPKGRIKRNSISRENISIRTYVKSNIDGFVTSRSIHNQQAQNEDNPPPTAPRSASSFLESTKEEFESPPKICSAPTVQNFLTKLKLPPIPSCSNTKSVSPMRHTPGLCGLKNIGNTCFMNSAIQCLNSIPILIEWAMKQPTPLSLTNVVDVYISLIQAMWSGRNSCFTPKDLKTFVSHAAHLFADYGQQDSHEFMNSLLNAIETTDPYSFIIDIFRISTESKTTCQKHQHIDMIHETTTFLSLPLLEIESCNPTSISLEHLIQDFCQENDLNGTYYCHQCNDYTPARQKTTIISPLPRALIIQLKRFPFDNSNMKINILVQYKLEYENLLSNNDKYKLSAISLHSGSLSGGHYTTIASNYHTRKWYRFDDSHVKEIDYKNLLVPFTAQQAYILIYLKEDD